jgi:hypothetical protein
MSLRAMLLLVPLLAAGCATAAPPAATPGDANASARIERVTSQAVVVRLPGPAHAAFVDVRPGELLVARWLNGITEERGTRSLPAGTHTISLSERIPRTASAAFRACNGPGERPLYDVEMARTLGGPGSVREVIVAGARVFCVRTGGATGERSVVMVVSPQPVSDGLLEEVLAEFNHRHAGIEADAMELARALSEALAAEWPGSAGYSARVPRS